MAMTLATRVCSTTDMAPENGIFCTACSTAGCASDDTADTIAVVAALIACTPSPS